MPNAPMSLRRAINLLTRAHTDDAPPGGPEAAWTLHMPKVDQIWLARAGCSFHEYMEAWNALREARKGILRSLDLTELRPLSEWHEDVGPVLWWKFPLDEPPYCGSPLDLGYEVVITGIATAAAPLDQSPNAPKPVTVKSEMGSIMVGGWPGYHTHWTPLPMPMAPREAPPKLPHDERGWQPD